MSAEDKRYSEEIRTLMSDVQNSVYMPSKRVFVLLRQLEKCNESLKDNELYGFIYYNYARVYSFSENHRELTKYITKALYYLLRSSNKDLLAKTYNIFGVEASKNGCLEIAYEYLAIAKSYVEEDSDSIINAMIDLNIGAVFSQLGDHKKALSHTAASYRVIQKNKDDESYYSNLVMALLNLALINLDLGNPDQSRKYLSRIERIDTDGELDLWHLVPRCRLSIHDSDKELTEELITQISRNIISGDMLGETVRDLKSLCMDLIENGEFVQAARLIDEIEKNRDRLFDYEAGLFTQVKINYYSETGNDEKLAESYEERNAYFLKQEETDNRLSFESITIMNLLVDLRREKRQAEEKNILLQMQAETDVLTGLPNRHALNRELESAFEEAVQNGSVLGVGIADIDRFKNYNDTYGHQQGDRCLIEVAGVLKTVAAKHGIFVSRYGGDEFTFIYRGLDCDSIKSIEKEITRCGDVELTHGFYCAVPNENTRIWDYLNKADKNLYDIRKNRK